jgi:AcrR family transcriptional regulator
MSTRPRRPLTRDRIVEAALAIADRQGLDGLSMRKVASRLGCEVMSLYNHVSSKDDLLDELLDRVFAEIELPVEGTAWRSALRSTAVAARAALVARPWAGTLLTGRFPGPLRRRYMNSLLEVLAAAGLPEDVADLGFHAITIHVQGFAQQQIGFAAGARVLSSKFDEYLEGDAGSDDPYFVAHLHYHEERGHRHDDFEFVLDLILDGLERVADSSPTP